MPSILTRPSGGAAAPAPSGGYVPPSDWLELPTPSNNEIYLLQAVFDGFNGVALSVNVSSGTWSIEWADGTTQTGIASGVTAESNVSYASGGLGSLTTRGYKTGVVKITTSGGNITTFNLAKQHSDVSSNSTHPWLHAKWAASSMSTRPTFRSTSVEADLLEIIDFQGSNNIVDQGFLFQNMTGLKKLSNWDFSTSTTGTSVFQNCVNLIEVSQIDGVNFSNLNNFARNAESLESITFTSLANVSSQTYAFAETYALKSISWTSPPQASNYFAFLFNSGIQNPPAVGGTVTNYQSVYRSDGIKIIPAIDLSNATNLSFWIETTNGSVARILATGATVTHSVANNLLDVDAMEEYANNLGDGTGQTLTTSGNPASGAWDTTIATNKNWTVVD